MMEYQIRNYQPSDQVNLLAFFRTVFTSMGFGFDLHSKHQDLCEIPAHYQSHGLFLLAAQNRTILGTAALR